MVTSDFKDILRHASQECGLDQANLDTQDFRILRDGASGAEVFYPGVGEQRMALHPFIDATWRAARGANCWADRDFREWYMKKNPEVRVRSVGTKIQSGYRGKRYTKSYGP